MKKQMTGYMALLLLLSSTCFAQDTPEPPGFVMFNQSIVPMADMGTVNQLADSLVRPIMDGLVEEGYVATWGILTHAWGDEWNWNWYMFTKDHEAFLTAWGEFLKRMSEAHPGAFAETAQFVEAHKDNLSSVRHFRGRQLDEGEEQGRFLMSNQSMVKQLDVGKMNALWDETAVPILDEMLEEKLIDAWGDLGHGWGDEWNVSWYMVTKDHASFVTAWDALVGRMMERHPDAFMEMSKLIQAHKDNLYYIQYAN